MRFTTSVVFTTALLITGMQACMAANAFLQNTAQFETLARGSHSGIETRDFTVIRDQRTFRHLWRRAFAHKQPMPTLPKVDFSENLVMALFLGHKRSGGYALAVRRIESHSKSLVVKVALSSPGKGCASPEAAAAPFQIIKLAATSKEILFETTPVHGSC